MASEVQAIPASSVQWRVQVVLALLAVYVAWGGTYLAIRVALRDFPPFLLGGYRFFTAGAALYLYLRLRGVPAPTRAQWAGSAVVGILLLVTGNGCVIYAEQWVASGVAALGLATTPLWAAMIAAGLGERTQARDWIGLLIGFAGIVLLNLDHGLRASPLGAALIAVASVSWALGSVIGNRLALPNGLMASAAQMLAAGTVFFAISLLHRDHGSRPRLNAAFWALAYLAICGSIIGYSAFSFLIRTVRPALAMSNAYVNPVVAVVAGVLIVHERVTLVEIVAAAVILIGVGIVMTARLSNQSAK